MVCPQCGYDMGNKSRCLRCGYVEKTLAVIDDSKENDGTKSGDKTKTENETPDVKVIDPCNVYLTHPYGYEDDTDPTGFGIFGSPFGSIFDDFFSDPIGDLLGGLFGFDVMGGSRRSSSRGRQHEEPQKKKRKQGPVVEMDRSDFEIVDDNGNPVEEHKKQHAAHEQHSAYEERKHKNPFKRKPKK